MSTAPEVLVGFGRSVELRGETVTVTATPGPGVPLRWGTLAIADPWFAPSVPEVQQISIGQGEQATVLSTIAVPRAGQPEPVEMSCAAAIGAVDNSALGERIVAMEVDGRVAAAVFLCPDGSGLYPAYAGFDRDLQAVAVLVDLKLLP